MSIESCIRVHFCEGTAVQHLGRIMFMVKSINLPKNSGWKALNHLLVTPVQCIFFYAFFSHDSYCMYSPYSSFLPQSALHMYRPTFCLGFTGLHPLLEAGRDKDICLGLTCAAKDFVELESITKVVIILKLLLLLLHRGFSTDY